MSNLCKYLFYLLYVSENKLNLKSLNLQMTKNQLKSNVYFNRFILIQGFETKSLYPYHLMNV